MMDLRFFLLFICLCGICLTTSDNPCPDFFVYDIKRSEADRWHGIITLKSNDDLQGVTLDLYFDKSVIQLGNWLGNIKSNNDNTRFTIRNNKRTIRANVEVKEKIFVVYDPDYDIPPPVLTKILLNGKEICPHFDNSTVNNNITHNLNIIVNVTFPQCGGTTIIRSVPLITEGQHTSPGQWPWHVAIYRTDSGKKQYICGGTLISHRDILTAAHCTTDYNGEIKKHLLMGLGKYLLRDSKEVLRNVSWVTVHPSFNWNYLFNDIAIIRLDGAVEITNFIRPVCLWEEDTALNSVINRTGTVVGWGRDHNGHVTTETLMQANMPVVDTLTCIYSNRSFYSQFTNEKNFCAGYKNGTSVCNGDSGGGLVFLKKGSNAVWQIRGIVSLATATRNFTCDTMNYVIFTDVAKYTNWIKTIIN